MKKTGGKILMMALVVLALLGGLTACNLPEQTGPSAPASVTPGAGGETLPAPGITPVVENPTVPAVTQEAPTALPSETAAPVFNTPVPPSATSPLPTVTPRPTNPVGDLTISRIEMVDLQNGFGEGFPAGGSTGLYRTADGGKTWTLINPPGGYGDGGEFFALNARSIWAAPGVSPQQGSSGLEKGFVYRSTDGGVTWSTSQPITLATGEVALVESFYPNSLFFLDENRGWLVISVGHYMNQDVVVILNTMDGGQNWARQTDKMQASQAGGASMPCQVLGIAFDTATHGFMAGNCLAVGMDERWKVLTSSDSGHTWNPVEIGAPVNAPAAVTGADAMCAASGLTFEYPQTYILSYTCQVYDSSAAIPTYTFTYVSTDGGKAWAGAEVGFASFYNSTAGSALGPRAANGDRYFYATNDGGRNWVKGHKVVWANAQLSFVDTKNAWAVVWRLNETSGMNDYALVRTTAGDGPWAILAAMVK